MTNLERDLSQSIEEALAAAAQRNEVRVAWVRALTLSIVCAIGLAISSELTLRVSMFWALCAWIIVARHGHYRQWIFRLTTLLDAAMIASFTFIVEPNQAVALAATAVVCTLAAITGAIRIKPGWVRVTTFLAIINVALASWRHGLNVPEGLMLCLLIAMAGVLGSWLARISRHALESDVHRVVAGRFLPMQVLDAGYRAPLSALTEAKAMDATVLISDIRSFTTLAETLPPPEVLDFLNQVQGTLAGIVQDHGGTVDKFMGDGMLAVFDGELHASRAVAAATAMAQASRTLEVRIGIGVHSGRIVAGVLGTGSRLEMTVIGDTVNIASRLDSLTKEKSVTALLSEAVVERAGESALVPLGPARLRGRSSEVNVYTLAA